MHMLTHIDTKLWILLTARKGHEWPMVNGPTFGRKLRMVNEGVCGHHAHSPFTIENSPFTILPGAYTQVIYLIFWNGLTAYPKSVVILE